MTLKLKDPNNLRKKIRQMQESSKFKEIKEKTAILI